MESDLRNLTRQGLIEEHCKMLVDDKNELWRERVRYGDACYPECARKSGPGGNFYGVQRGRSGGFLLPVAFGAKGRTQVGAPTLRSDLRRLHEEQTSTEKHNVGEQES